MEGLDCGVSRPTRACMERRTLVRADVGWTLNDDDDDDDDVYFAFIPIQSGIGNSCNTAIWWVRKSKVI